MLYQQLFIAVSCAKMFNSANASTVYKGIRHEQCTVRNCSLHNVTGYTDNQFQADTSLPDNERASI